MYRDWKERIPDCGCKWGETVSFRLEHNVFNNINNDKMPFSKHSWMCNKERFFLKSKRIYMNFAQIPECNENSRGKIGMIFLVQVRLIPLSHYSRNAPRIHNVGHFFQIAKVPSGVCKFRPAFVLDSVTFVAIAKCSQMQLHVGNLFHFPQNSWVHWEPNTTNIRVYEYDTMKQERKTTLMRTFVRIYCDGWEWKECQTTLLRIIRPLHECNTILTNQRRISWQCGEIYVIGQLCAFNTTLLGLSRQWNDAFENQSCLIIQMCHESTVN